MHELSIALSILEVAAEEAERRRARVVSIHVKLGALSGVVKEALLSAYELARAGTPLAESVLMIEEIPVVAYCPSCATEKLTEFPSLLCPTCGTPSHQVIQGRELEIVALEIEQ